MTEALAKKRIILIHGLAPKPQEPVWLDLCRACLVENIRVDDAQLGAELDASPTVVQSAYWADCVPYHIPDDEEFCCELSKRVQASILERKNVGDNFHVGIGEHVGAFFKDRGADLVNVFSNALTIKPEVMKRYLVETRFYSEEQYVADRMRKPLEEQLMQAWQAGQDVALLSHSMGTFIAYDALWRFSHRNVDPYRGFHGKQVQLFVTMGSPLCDSAVREMLFAYHHQGRGQRQFPTNLRMWHNYACLGDVVCHGADFQDCYFKGLREQGVMSASATHALIDYANLHNPFSNVEHEGNKDREKRNPHKEYGYLVQPRLGTWLADFLRGRLKFD